MSLTDLHFETWLPAGGGILRDCGTFRKSLWGRVCFGIYNQPYFQPCLCFLIHRDVGKQVHYLPPPWSHRAFPSVVGCSSSNCESKQIFTPLCCNHIHTTKSLGCLSTCLSFHPNLQSTHSLRTPQPWVVQ